MAERFSLSIRDRHGFERSIPINRTVTLGRQNQCEIVLSDSMVSRNHLRIEEVDGEWWAEDLGSSHGSYFREARLTRLKWEPGSTVRLADGAYYLTLRSEAALAPEVNLQAILQTAHLLTGQVELDDLLEQTLERLLSLSNTDRGFIMLPESGDLVVKVARNLSPQLEKDIHLSMSSVRRVFEKGDPIWIHNVASDEKLMAQQSIMDLQLKTILCLPLMVQGECIGVAYLDSRRIVTEPVDRATFEAIVSLCAIAIERTRLSEDNLRNQVLATVGQVASSIVHDFKNALFVIAGHAQLMQTTTQDEKSHHHLAQILGAVDRLSQLSGDVLDYSKVREPNREDVDLHEYINDLLEPHLTRASELGASIRCEGPACKASIDRFRFARVVENLLANSLDAINGREGGEVVVHWAPGTNDLRITIQDNGKGIPRKVLKRIFEPFFSHGKNKGTGLGMPTVKKIIEEHGGSLEVQSEEEQGTSVIIWIPDGDNQTKKEDTTGRIRILNQGNQ
ncbi:MAG: ATP-binding protein [Holophaga sp.]|nr:ATP-binding protein [Holophaga sp.]